MQFSRRRLFRRLVRAFLFALPLLVLGGWLGLATAAWAYLRYRTGYETVSWGMVAFPWRWDERRVAQGRELVQRGLEATRQERWGEALFLLRNGVGLDRGNLVGRVALAKILSAINQPERAIEVLAAAAESARSEPAYIAFYLQLLLDDDQDERVLAYVDLMIGPPEGADDLDRSLALSAATSLVRLNRYREAEQWLTRYKIAGIPEALVLLARSRWESGREEEALALLRAGLRAHPRADVLYRKLAEYLAARGAYSEAASVTLVRRLARPDDPAVEMEAAVLQHQAGDVAAFRDTVRRAVASRPASRELLLIFGGLAARFADSELLEDVLRAGLAAGVEVPEAPLLRAETLARHGNSAEALAELTRLKESPPDWMPAQAPTVDLLEAVCQWRLGDVAAAGAAFERFMGHGITKTDVLRSSAQLVEEVGMRDGARRIYQSLTVLPGAGPQPLRALLELELELGEPEEAARVARAYAAKPGVEPADLREVSSELSLDRRTFLPGREEILARLESRLNAATLARTPSAADG